METQNHLGDALDSYYITAEEHQSLFNLADRAIGASTKLHQYLTTCPPRGTRNPRTRSRERRTPNQERRTRNREP